MMKQLTILALLLLIANQLQAQPLNDNLELQRKITHYRIGKMAGVTCLIIGVVKLKHPDEYYGYGKPPSNFTTEVAGYIFGGIAGIATGIPMWTVGGYKHAKYKQIFNETTVTLNVSPQVAGLALTIHW